MARIVVRRQGKERLCRLVQADFVGEFLEMETADEHIRPEPFPDVHILSVKRLEKTEPCKVRVHTVPL